MDSTEEDQESFDDGSLDISANEEPEGQRAIIRLALNEIATELGDELQAANLDIKVFLTVPNSGKSIATIATPTDPPDEEWTRVSEIASHLIAKRLGDIKLQGRALPCAMAHSRMNATEITPNRISFEV